MTRRIGRHRCYLYGYKRPLLRRGTPPPPCFCWTSHNLRKGAASDAYAIKVRLTDIRYAGGWSTISTVLESKYVDFTMRPTKAALLFFGYLKKDAPAYEPRSGYVPRRPDAYIRKHGCDRSLDDKKARQETRQRPQSSLLVSPIRHVQAAGKASSNFRAQGLSLRRL